MPRGIRKGSLADLAHQRKVKREKAWRDLHDMPRYSRARDTYERLLRQETRAEGMWLATKREADRVRYERAKRQRERFGRAINAYEDRYLEKNARSRSRENPRRLDRGKPAELQVRREQEKARRLVRLAARGGLSPARAGSLYRLLERQKRRLETQHDARSRQLSRQITHVLSRYVGPAERAHRTEKHRGKKRRPPERSPERIPAAKRARISAEIRRLRREGYGEKQAIAIAYRTAGVARKRR